MLRTSLCSLILLAMACHGPTPPEAIVDFRLEHGVAYGLSTEAGILLMSDLVPEGAEQLPFRYHVGNGMFDDVAQVKVRGDAVSVLQPKSSQPNQARFAASPVLPTESLFLETRNDANEPELLEGTLYNEGLSGNLLVPDRDAGTLAADYAGAGVYVYRDGFLQIVGVLNGVYSDQPNLLAFIGIDEIAMTVPRPTTYFERISLPKRADFEYGIPRDIEGEGRKGSGAGPIPPLPETEPEF